MLYIYNNYHEQRFNWIQTNVDHKTSLVFFLLSFSIIFFDFWDYSSFTSHYQGCSYPQKKPWVQYTTLAIHRMQMCLKFIKFAWLGILRFQSHAHHSSLRTSCLMERCVRGVPSLRISVLTRLDGVVGGRGGFLMTRPPLPSGADAPSLAVLPVVSWYPLGLSSTPERGESAPLHAWRGGRGWSFSGERGLDVEGGCGWVESGDLGLFIDEGGVLLWELEENEVGGRGGYFPTRAGVSDGVVQPCSSISYKTNKERHMKISKFTCIASMLIVFYLCYMLLNGVPYIMFNMYVVYVIPCCQCLGHGQ